MNWVPHVTGDIGGRVLAPEYLQARADAYDRDEHLDPVLRDLKATSERDELGIDSLLFWLAFMAGSDWQREYRGRLHNDEQTSANP